MSVDSLLTENPETILSVSARLIPFVEHNDNLRVHMACSQIRQSVGLSKPEPPLIFTGFEEAYVDYSNYIYRAEFDGVVLWKTSQLLVVGAKDKSAVQVIPLWYNCYDEFDRTVYPRVEEGDEVKKDQILAASIHFDEKGRLALGCNLLTAVLSYKGWNFEDAIVATEYSYKKMSYRRIAKRHVFLGHKRILAPLDKSGQLLPKVNQRYAERDVLLAITSSSPHEPAHLFIHPLYITAHASGTLKMRISVAAVPGSVQNTQWGKTLQLIQAKLKQREEKLVEIIAQWLSIPTRKARLLVAPYMLTENPKLKSRKDELVYCVIELVLIDDVPLQIGSKLANRHGNKGVISTILSKDETPIVETTAQPVELIINPLGIISRMNVGQLFELHLNRAAENFVTKLFAEEGDVEEIKSKLLEFISLCDNTGGVYSQIVEKNFKALGKRKFKALLDDIRTLGLRIWQPPFRSITFEQLDKIMEYTKTPYTEPIRLPDGRVVEAAVGKVYWFRLVHEPDRKIFARSVGPYTELGQPVGGKKASGGHRFGEMEVWALFAHGAKETLFELLNIKSDNPEERKRLLEHLYLKALDVYKPQSISTVTADIFKTVLKGCGLEFKELDKDEE